MVWNHGRDIAVDGFVTVVDGAYVLKNSGGVNISSIFSLLMLRCYRHPVCTENSIRRRRSKRTAQARILMTDLFRLILGILASRFKARATLEAENLVLRQQLNVVCTENPKSDDSGD